MSVNLMDENLKLEGDRLEVGQAAPNFKLTTIEEKTIKEFSLEDFEDKIKIISTFPSIDTSVCDFQTKRFIEKYSSNENLKLINVSSDLPFAFSKWCSINEVNNKNVYMLSDYRTHQFAKDYGINILGADLTYRAIFILDKDNTVLYIQYAKKVPEHLNYEEIEEKLKMILSQ